MSFPCLQYHLLESASLLLKLKQKFRILIDTALTLEVNLERITTLWKGIYLTRQSMSFCFSHLPLCLSIEFYTFYLIGLAYFFSSLLLDILSFYCNCSFTFFSFPLLYLFYESGLVSQEQEILLGILVQEDIMWELVSDLLEVSRSKRRRDFTLRSGSC